MNTPRRAQRLRSGLRSLVKHNPHEDVLRALILHANRRGYRVKVGYVSLVSEAQCDYAHRRITLGHDVADRCLRSEVSSVWLPYVLAHEIAHTYKPPVDTSPADIPSSMMRAEHNARCETVAETSALRVCGGLGIRLDPDEETMIRGRLAAYHNCLTSYTEPLFEALDDRGEEIAASILASMPSLRCSA